MHNIEGLIAQHGQILHGGPDGLDVVAASSAFTQIQFQHGVTEVDNGDDCAGSGIQNGLPASACRQTQDSQAGHTVRQPAASIE